MRMNELQVFNFNNSRVRAIIIEDNPYFIGKDVAEILGYERADNAIRNHVDSDDKLMHQISASGQKRNMTLINESGLYSLILSSKLPKAKEFKHWVTSEVLPTIRKHGAYMNEDTIEKALTSPDFLIQLATKLKEEKEKNKSLATENKMMKPKALFADAVETSTDSILVGQLAKLISQNGCEIGQNRLFKRLREDGFLCCKGENYNMPTQKSMNMGLMEIKERTVNNPDGSIRTTRTPKITGKGQVYFVNKFLNELN